MIAGSDGKMKVQKLGLGEETRSGFNYEMDLVFEIEQDTHIATISKDRTNIFKDEINGFIITEKTGEALTNWAMSGATSNLDEAMNQVRCATNMDQLTNVYQSYKELHTNEDFKVGLGLKKKELTNN